MIPLSTLLEKLPYLFIYPSVDKFLDIHSDLTNLVSLSAPDGTTNSGQFLALPDTINKINSLATSIHSKVAIVPFKPSAKIEHLCRQNQWLLVANLSSTNRHLEDKINFTTLCLNNQLPILPHLITHHSLQNFTKALALFGSPLVAQTRFGWAGKSTFLLTKYSSDHIAESTPVKYLPLISGYTLLNNCCLYHHRLLSGPPALQYTGIPKLTTNPFTTVGRQWPSNAPQIVLDQIDKITQQFSTILDTDYQYRGYFGLDFIVDGQQRVFLLECNPRLTASFDFYHQLESAQSPFPLFHCHLASFIDTPLPSLPSFPTPKIVGSEIVKKDHHSNTIKRIRKNIALSPTPQPVTLPRNILQQLQ